MIRSRRLQVPVVLGLWVISLGLAGGQAPRHFVVVISAASANAVTATGLRQAENRVADLLFKKGAVLSGQSWYRFGRDYVTILESGPGPRKNEVDLAGQGLWSQVDSDYVRPITRPAIRIRESRFRELLHPGPTSRPLDANNVLSAGLSLWAGAPRKVSQTILISLTQQPAADPALPGVVYDRLREIGAKFTVGQSTIQAAIQGQKEATYYVSQAEIHFGAQASHRASIQPTNLHSRIQVAWRVLVDAMAIALLAWIGRWVWYERRKARHFEFWIPGFATAFTLPPISESVEANFRARLPRYGGEPAAHLQLPRRSIRLLFYSRAKLRWDPRLQVDGLDPSISAYPVRRLRRFVRFLWVERPTDEGNLGISVERPRMLGGNDQIVISVNFLALPRSDPEP